MFDLATILAGLGDAITPINILFVILGVVVGQFVGAVPGIGPVITIALAIPFTYVLSPLTGIAFLVGINKGGLVGGAIPAILINTPGTPDAAATALDGYPLAQKGKPLKAAKMALYSSVTGDTFSDMVLITVSPPLALVALMMGPIEIVCLLIFAFAVIAGLIGKSLTKGIIAAALGLLCASVGLDPEHSSPRFIFGLPDLFDGLPITSVAIGMLAAAEIFRRLAARRKKIEAAITFDPNQPREDKRVSWFEYWSCRFTIARGAIIGTLLGAAPGIGTTAASFMSYAAAKQSSKEPETFGKGNIQGIAATESANSAVMGANMIPMLTLGIPGSVSAALIIGALIIHGIQPGPLLFEQQGRLIYGLFGAMIMANFCNFWIGLVGLRLWAFVIRAPESIIFPFAIMLCVVGVYLSTGTLFGVAVMLVFAAVGYLMTSVGISVVVFIIAFFLGKRFELSLNQSLTLIDGDPAVMLDHPVAIALLVLAVLTAYWLSRKKPSAGE